ncbi:diguanylate cyclase [Sulfobacillus sp. DSM 109850]|uniref:Diguanylate cyclase n=2 Tax=Sulfobacillus harzensis TaxID=2729629 RepID=A0A7Y0L2W0_9FIRM|nr:diguanylate cyclase [Sulfobacillus harzensis]
MAILAAGAVGWGGLFVRLHETGLMVLGVVLCFGSALLSFLLTLGGRRGTGGLLLVALAGCAWVWLGWGSTVSGVGRATVAIGIILMALAASVLAPKSAGRWLSWTPLLVGAGMAAALISSVPHLLAILGCVLGVAAWLFILSYAKMSALRSEPSGRQAALDWGGAQLRQGPMGVMCGEIAGFAGLTAIYGEDGAGRLLFSAIQELGRSARRHDRVLWLGGGEFLVLLPGSPYESERVIQKRIIAVLEGFGPWGSDVDLGWAWGAAGASFEEVLNEAERAMHAIRSRRRAASNHL